MMRTYLSPRLFLLTVVGYEEYALTYPPEVVIKWIQAVFAAFDDIVEPRNARGYSDMVDDSTHGGMNVVKFETFHDFYFLVSGCPQVNAPAHRMVYRARPYTVTQTGLCGISELLID